MIAAVSFPIHRLYSSTAAGRMSRNGKPGEDLQYRCMLCKHGPECIRGDRCRYAHALDECLPPDERERTLIPVWKDGVSKWYGQPMPQWMLYYILWYYERTHECERPLWAKAVLWFYGMLPPAEHVGQAPWDFGIYNDYKIMRMMRVESKPPFSFAQGFHHRMSERHSQMTREVNPLPSYLLSYLPWKGSSESWSSTSWQWEPSICEKRMLKSPVRQNRMLKSPVRENRILKSPVRAQQEYDSSPPQSENSLSLRSSAMSKPDMRDASVLTEEHRSCASSAVSSKRSEVSKSDMRDVSSKGSQTSDSSPSPWDAEGSEVSRAGLNLDDMPVSTVKAEGVSRDVEVKTVAAVAVRAMDVLREKSAAAVGMQTPEFGDKIWLRQEEHHTSPESEHPPVLSDDGGSSGSRRSRSPRG